MNDISFENKEKFTKSIKKYILNHHTNGWLRFDCEGCEYEFNETITDLANELYGEIAICHMLQEELENLIQKVKNEK